MKQSAAKTLGVAVLGAAFAAAAAGTASAAPAPVPASLLNPVTELAPAQDLLTTLPVSDMQSLADGQALPTGGEDAPAADLLGGLPAAPATGDLPIG